jgi:hypothetical protein
VNSNEYKFSYIFSSSAYGKWQKRQLIKISSLKSKNRQKLLNRAVPNLHPIVYLLSHGLLKEIRSFAWIEDARRGKPPLSPPCSHGSTCASTFPILCWVSSQKKFGEKSQGSDPLPPLQYA